MKLPRPYIPLDVRIEVARRQYLQYDPDAGHSLLFTRCQWFKKRRLLEILLKAQFGDSKVQLDHDPALCNREYNPKTKQYTPDANDPNYLTYIKAESHRVKTFLRGEGARRSDMGQRRYLKRVNAKRNPKPRFKPRAAKQIRRIPHASVTTNNGD